jgi:hypothetical protein
MGSPIGSQPRNRTKRHLWSGVTTNASPAHLDAVHLDDDLTSLLAAHLQMTGLLSCGLKSCLFFHVRRLLYLSLDLTQLCPQLEAKED